MNPLAINPLAMLGGAVIMAAIGFGAGWQTNGWRLNGELAEQKSQTADEARQRAEVALADIAGAAKKINDAAGGARVDQGRVLEKLAAIDRRFKNEKPPALPPDCIPGDIRMRRLNDAAATANEAIAGPKPGR